MHYSFKLEDLLDEAKGYGVDISKITNENWYLHNNNEMLNTLRKIERSAIERASSI